MNNVNKPNKRTFWEVNADGKLLKGLTEINQVTSTKFPITSSDNADDVYPPLPNVGTPLKEGEIYSYQGGMIEVRQDHVRTNFEPIETPNLFTVYRANTEGAEWIANEEVIRGDTRTFNGETWRCIQSHTTQANWTPDVVPALWVLVPSQPDIIPNWEQGGGTGTAGSYNLGDEVYHDNPNDNGNIWLYRSKIPANTTEPGRDGTFDRWWEPVNVKP